MFDGTYLIDVTNDQGQAAINKWFSANSNINFIVSLALSGLEAERRINANASLQMGYLSHIAFLASQYWTLGYNISGNKADYPNETAVFIGGNRELLVKAHDTFAVHKKLCGGLSEQCYIAIRKDFVSDKQYNIVAYLDFGQGFDSDNIISQWDFAEC